MTQRYKVRAEDGAKFVMTRREWPTEPEAQACAARMAATESEGALYEVVNEDPDGVPQYVPPPPPPGPDLQAHIDRCRAYVVSTTVGDVADQLDTYLATASPTAADTLKVVKETVRTLRSLIRVVRGIAE